MVALNACALASSTFFFTLTLAKIHHCKRFWLYMDRHTEIQTEVSDSRVVFATDIKNGKILKNHIYYFLFCFLEKYRGRNILRIQTYLTSLLSRFLRQIVKITTKATFAHHILCNKQFGISSLIFIEHNREKMAQILCLELYAASKFIKVDSWCQCPTET